MPVAVDEIQLPENLLCFFFIRRPATSESALRACAHDALKEIAGAKSRRLRNRTFVVWYGQFTNVVGDDLDVVALPSGVASDVVRVFRSHLPRCEGRDDLGDYPARDIYARPLLRYSNGEIAAYLEPGSEDGHTCILKVDETRRYVLRRTRRSTVTRPPSFVPSPSARVRHSIESWQATRDSIVEFVGHLEAPLSYRTLRRIVETCFGIHVDSAAPPSLSGHGALRTDFILDSEDCTVRIIVNSRLPEKLKTVVLAHELAHYALHFPVLFALQEAEELSWECPEVHWAMRGIIAKHLKQGLSTLEEDANIFAVYSLLPPRMFPLRNMASYIFEVGRSRQPTGAELVWHFLQPLFPDTSRSDYSWRNWDEAIERANRETATARGMSSSDATDLYRMTLAAAVSVEDGMADKIRERATSAVLAIWNDFVGLLNEWAHQERDSVRETLRTRYGAYRSHGSQYGTELARRKKVVAPLDGVPGGPFRCLPLRPASYNRRGHENGDWKLLNVASSPAGTVEEWREFRTRQGLILYPYDPCEPEQSLLR